MWWCMMAEKLTTIRITKPVREYLRKMKYKYERLVTYDDIIRKMIKTIINNQKNKKRRSENHEKQEGQIL
jgi:hypothetical protein